jgi:RecA/RadA recombinase
METELMATDMRKARASKLAEKIVRSYGDQAAVAGHSHRDKKYYSTGITAVDYMMGTWGFPDCGFVEVFGPPGLGKTTIFGFGVMKSVQAAGGLTAFVATEPDVDEDWMERFGVNLDYNVIMRPDNAEQAFEITKQLIYDSAVDYIVFDSLGGTSSAKEQNSDKPQAYGNSALNTWGVNRIAAKSYKNRIGVMFINQVRDRAAGQLTILDSPGGHALKHAMKIRIQVKPGKDKFTVKVPSAESAQGTSRTDDMMVGREVRAAFIKNKAAEELGKQAVFKFYQVKTDEFPFGIDVEDDVINVAKMTGVITGSGWLNHPVFPDGKIQGTDKAIKWLRENPKAVEKLRDDIHKVMVSREALEARKKAEVVDKIAEA